MAVAFLRQALVTKPCVANIFSCSLSPTSISVPGMALTVRYFSQLVRFRPLVDALTPFHRLPPSASGLRRFATHKKKKSSLDDPKSIHRFSTKKEIKKDSILRSKEMMELTGRDFKHWMISMKAPEGNPTREEIIDSYVKTLAMVVGSEDEARRRIYSVSLKDIFFFGALVSEELSYKMYDLPGVFKVFPDFYHHPKNKKYEGEPFINGQAFPKEKVPTTPVDPYYCKNYMTDKYPGGSVDFFEWHYTVGLLRGAKPNFNFQIRETPPMPTMGGAPPNQMPTMDEAPPNQMLDIGGAQPNPMPNMEEAPPNLMPNLRGEPSNPMPNMGGGPSNLMPQERFSEQGCGNNSEDMHYQSRDMLTGSMPNRDYQSHYTPNRDMGNMPSGNPCQPKKRSAGRRKKAL